MKREFTIQGVTVVAHRYRTAVRRVRGFLRGEMDINGKNIPVHLRGKK